MICKHYHRDKNIEQLRQLSEIGKEGVNLLGISNAAEKIGFRTIAVQIPVEVLANDGHKPCILHWQQNHFVVLYKTRANLF